MARCVFPAAPAFLSWPLWVAALAVFSGLCAAEPLVSGFTPQIGLPGTLVKIVGAGLDSIVAVRFHGVEAESVRVVSSTHLKAVVPRRATSGPIEVVGAGGSAAVSALPFLVEPPGGIRLAFALPRPNPAKGPVAWRFSLSRPGPACLTVYALRGGPVRRICAELGYSGAQELTWDGRDASGRRVPSGVYFGVLEAEGRRARRQVTLVW